MPKSQEIQVKITGRVDSSYNKSVTAASQKMNELTKGSKNISGSFADAEKSSRSFGSGSSEAVSNLDAALASAGIMAILNETAQAFMECVEAAEQYETALAKISTIADPAQASMETIKNDITTLSQDTGQSVNDLSESVYQAISASVETADAVDFVRQSNMLAVGGFTDTTNKLFALAEQTTVTTAAQEEMKAIIAKLNSEYEGLNLTYDDVISKTANTKEALKGYLEALYNKEQYQNAQSQWTETYALLQKQEEQFDKLKREAVAASDKYRAAVEENDGFATVWDYQEYEDFWKRQIEYTNAAGETVKGTFREAFEEAEGNIESMKGKLDEYESKMLEVSGATDEAAESQKKWEEAASEAIQGVQGDLDNLAAAYDEAFESAQKSIQNTVSLTSELSNETEITTGKLTETWESQIEWIKKYSENLQKAQKYGITDGLITSLSDGSEESGKYINQIISELDGLNENDAKELVKKLNDDFNGVKSAEGEFAKTVADYKTDFSNTMDSLQKKAESTINAMNLSDEAKKSAKETVQAYVSEINSQIAGASFGNATGAVKSAVLSALTPNGVYAYAQASPFVEANAKGTKHSADVFLAGEEGPELIVNAEGSQVFTAAETQRILSGDADEESGDRYSFDLPELIRQLAEDDDASRPTLAERADALDSGDSNSYSSSSVNHISYSPTFAVGAKLKLLPSTDSTITDSSIIFQVFGYNHFKISDTNNFANVVFGMLGTLNQYRQMNAGNTNVGGFNASAMQTWLNGTMINNLSKPWQALIKTVDVLASKGGTSYDILTTRCKLFLFADPEVGANKTATPYMNEVDPGAESLQFPIFTDNASRIKKTAKKDVQGRSEIAQGKGQNRAQSDGSRRSRNGGVIVEEIAETLLCIIDAQQSFIRRLVRIISETESVDDALRERITEESAEPERIAKNALEG